MAAATGFLVATVSFFGFELPLLTVIKSFIPFGNFLLKKLSLRRPQTASLN
jgi:hypothetical protein